MDKMYKVSIVRCEDYEYSRVKKAVSESVELLGGMSAFVDPGDKVLLKVNLLMKRKPEKATTTHPAVARALAELVLEVGGKPIIGDSPGGYHFYSRSTLEAVYDTCGMKWAAESSGAELNYDTGAVDVSYPQGKLMKSIKTIQPVLDADKIINIPKIKTHMMTVYSGAVKNLFGIIPGSYKAEYHLRFEDTMDFADVLIDLCLYAKPVLTVMDAVVGMEGYGPTNGSPREVGLILAGADPFALDVIAAQAIGLPLKKVPTILRAEERGLCYKPEEIEVVGEALEQVLIDDFKKPTLKLSFNFYNLLMPRFISKWLNRIMKARPVINFDACKGCGTCQRSCPPQVIQMEDGRPRIDLERCIRCFCCHELCTYNAVDIKRPWLIKLLLH